MRLGVLTSVLSYLPFDKAAEYLASCGVQAVEVGCGGYPGKAHCDAAELLSDPEALSRFRAILGKNRLELAALSCHGNPVHPDKEKAADYDRQFRNAILLAEKLGIDRVVGFSGCPGDCPESKHPNWVVCNWPTDFQEVLKYQWPILIDYWRGMAEFAQQHGVNRIALEMHQGFCVHNPATLLRLREAVGPVIGANFDPSHLFWQGIDPVAAIRALSGAIYFFHAKDTRLDPARIAVNGVLDSKPSEEMTKRSWSYRTVGYGHGVQTWNDIFSELKLAGYDDVISIEHEDGLMSPTEGLLKAIDCLKGAMIFQSRR